MIRRAARRLPNGATNEGAGPPASFCVRPLSYFDDREPAMSKAGKVYCSAVEQELPESGHAGLGEESGGIFGSLSCPTQLPAPTSRSLQQTASRTVGSTDCTILSQRTLAGQANRAARSRPAQDRAAQAE